MIKVGIVCPFPPEKISQGVYALKVVRHTKARFVTIGTLKSKADYKIDLKSFSLKKELEKIIRKEKLDVLHLQYIAPFYGKYTLNLNLLPVFKLKIPIVTTMHEVQPKRGGIRHKILEFIERKVVNGSDRVIVHAPAMAELLRKKYNAGNISVVVLGHYNKSGKKRVLRNILFFGVLSPGKGLEYMIRAMKSLKGYRLTIAGSMPDAFCVKYKDRLVKEIKRLKLDNVKIESHSWMSEEKKESYYKKADLVVLPYVWGPYNSAVVQDACEFMLPVVVTKVGTIWDIPSRHNLGVVVKPRNSDELVNAVKKVFSSYNKYKGNVRKFTKKFSWKFNGEEHLGVYRRVIR